MTNWTYRLFLLKQSVRTEEIVDRSRVYNSAKHKHFTGMDARVRIGYT